MDCLGVILKNPVEEEMMKRKITIQVTAYDNLIPTYPVADAVLKVDFAGQTLLQTDKVPIISNYNIPVDYTFNIEFDWMNFAERDKMLSNPISMILTETAGSMDPSLYNVNMPKSTGMAIWQSINSVMELQEALMGKPEEDNEAEETEVVEKKKRSSAKSSRDRKSNSNKAGDDKKKEKSKASGTSSIKSSKSKSSAKGSSSEKFKRNVSPTADTTQTKRPNSSDPIILGIGTIDLLNVFLGNNEPEQSVLLKQYPAFFDDRMMIISKAPVIRVRISIDDDCICRSVFNLTMESIFNIPDVFGPDLMYKIHIPFPSAAADTESINLESEKYKTEKCAHQKKLWPMINETNVDILETYYWINECVEDVQNSLNVDMQNIWSSNRPRIEFNIIKRHLLSVENSVFFKNQISEFRKIPLEIFIQKPRELSTLSQNIQQTISMAKNEKDKSSKKDKKADKKSKKEKTSDRTSNAPNLEERETKTDYLHLMGYIDVSRLLYPGEHRTRVMVPLRTYQECEIKNQTGLGDSYFIPKPKPVLNIPVLTSVGVKKSKSKNTISSSKTTSKKASKKSSSSKIKTKNKTGSKQKITKGEMKEKLPPPPVILPPSIQVYNETGEITFMIIEIDLNAPIYPPRDLENLTQKLHELIPPQPPLPKEVISSRVSREFFRETVHSLTENMIKQYHQFREDPLRSKIPAKTRKKILNDFLKYLKIEGVYHIYLATINRAAACLANEHFCYTGTNATQYQRFVSEIYVYLITEVNKELNLVLVKPMPKQIKHDMSNLSYYAKEAIELKDYTLADRYLLQRICSDEYNSTYWFDYAVFYMSMNQFEDAYECCRESLIIDTSNYNSLLLYAMLLERKNRRTEAETWMEMSEEVGHKNLITGPTDNLAEDDFAWTTKIMPNTLFYRTACLFIKMRLLDEAEMALSNEITSDVGIKEYFLAVIAYFRQDYRHCEQHINEAKRLHGSDYAVGSLRGHCYMQLNQQDEAIKEYNHILLSYSRPDDIHMLYMYSAFAFDKLKDGDKALQLMLQACKYGGTPLTWMGAGVLFLQKGDFVKAEECLSYANMLDNRLAEVWGYLVLVNINLESSEQADICYKQAIKNGLTNPNLMEDIKNAFKKIPNDVPI